MRSRSGTGSPGSKRSRSRGSSKRSGRKVSAERPSDESYATVLLRWWPHHHHGSPVQHLSTGVVLAALYHQAEVDVSARLEGPVWSSNGAVYSGPLELWPGLRITPEELARDLSAAGYARVRDPSSPGDFAVSSRDVYIIARQQKIPGYRIPASEVHVAFAEGTIRAVSPSRRVRLAPVELAGLRGPDNEARHPVSVEGLPDHVVQPSSRWRMRGSSSTRDSTPSELLRPWSEHRVVRAQTGGSTLTQQLVKNLFPHQ